MFLTDDELFELTKRRRSDAQVRVLKFMGIEHKVRPDGSVAVLRAHVEQEMHGAATASRKRTEPDWNAIAS